MTELGHLLDREALDRAEGQRGRMTIAVPPDWLARGYTLDVVVPSRLVCARCEGGGCDGCSRSGAVRVAVEGPARTVRVALPLGGSAPVLIRLVRPLGSATELEQLVLEVRVAEAPTSGCERAAEAAPAPRSIGPTIALALVVLALATAIATSLR